jgi:hypothetical protein
MLRPTCLFAFLLAAALLGTALAEVRTWRDTTGKFSIEAELLEETDTEIKLKKNDGYIKTVPKKLLSKEDLAYLEKFRAEKRKNQKWRKDYNALVETIKVKDLGGGKYDIDWGEAKDLGDWYKLVAARSLLTLEVASKKKRTPAKVEELKDLIKKVDKAHEALEGVEWSGKVIFTSQSPNKSLKMDFSPLPKPLRMVFWLDEDDQPNWASVKNGDTIRFVVRFDAREWIEYPSIEARLTLK